MSNVRFTATRPLGSSTNDYDIYMEKDDAPPVIVARVYDNVVLTHEENQAVKNLIAAAPELLEALKEAHHTIGLLLHQTALDRIPSGVADQEIERAQLIAKAEGKA